MPDLLVCSRCGQPVPVGAPAGQCPACLLRLGLFLPNPDDTPPTAMDSQVLPTRVYREPASTIEINRAFDSTVSTDGVEFRTTAAGGPVVGGRPVQFGHYELHEELGRGGMGIVFRAIQAIARREVAVKVLMGGAAGEALFGGRFAAEVSALANLRHPNIVTVYEVGEVNGSAFFSMEFAPNGTLGKRLKDGAMSFAEAALVVGKLAEATEAAHQLGVLHRDIKPGNVLIAADGEPKLSDFGLAKWVNRDDGLTASGAVMGTPNYMAPEQARGAKDVAVAADVYALGATLYECLTGQPPFRGTDPYTIMQRVIAQEPDSPRKFRRDVPPELEAVCLKCLEKNPAKRYDSASELAKDLARWRNGESTIARPLTRTQRVQRSVRKHWKVVAATVCLTLGGGGTAFAMAWFDPERQVDRAVRNDDRVVLVGPTGPPKWRRWAVVAGSFPPSEPNLPFQLATDSTAYLELAKDTYTDHYRLSAEFRIESSTYVDSWAGLYVAWRCGTVTDTGTVSRALVTRHREDRITKKPFDNVLGDPISLEDSLIIVNAKNPNGYTTTVPLGVHWSGEVNRDDRNAGAKRDWRYVEIEVRPESVMARWREKKSGELVAVRCTPGSSPNSIPASTIQETTAYHTKVVGRLAPDLLPGPTPYQPRGALGVYARNGLVAFRNVVFERLDENPSP